MNNQVKKQRGFWWKMANSWWILLSFFMLGGIGFIIIGSKTRKKKWKIIGILYLFLTWGSAAAYEYAGDWLLSIGVVAYTASIIHSFLVRNEYLLRLDAFLNETEALIADEVHSYFAPQNVNNNKQAYQQNVVSDLADTDSETEKAAENSMNPVTPEKIIDISNCSAEELEQLPGITIVAAKKAVAYRTEHGGFSSNEEFYSVVGVDTKPHFIVQIQNKITCGTYSGAAKVNERRTKLDFD